MSRITSIVFTKDLKTMIVGAKDGTVAFYNSAENFRQIAILDAQKDMGIPRGEEELEVNALCVINVQKHKFLAVGTNVGQIAVVDLHTQKVCYLEEGFISSETVHLFFQDDKLVCLN